VSRVKWWRAEMGGLAVLILAPVGDFVGVERSLIVPAFQSAAGIVTPVTPISAVVMGGLAIARVPYERWLRFVWPVLMGLNIIKSSSALASTCKEPRHDDRLWCPFRGGQAAPRDGSQTGLGGGAADAPQLRRFDV